MCDRMRVNLSIALNSSMDGRGRGELAQRKNAMPCMVIACKKTSRSASDMKAPCRTMLTQDSVGAVKKACAACVPVNGNMIAVLSPVIKSLTDIVQSMRPLAQNYDARTTDVSVDEKQNCGGNLFLSNTCF